MKRIIKSFVGLTLAVSIVVSSPMQAQAGFFDWLFGRNKNQDIVVNTGAEYYAEPLAVEGVSGPERKEKESLFKATQYYYKTGLSCPKEATYSKYKLLERVRKGDIIYEALGAGGIAGHTAIVEGIYDRGDGTKYIRLIEAIGDGGVCRGILDDKRADAKAAYVLRVKGADQGMINRAVSFCEAQLGKPYRLDFKHDFDRHEAHWYCSEIVWAAYFLQGINIETTGSLNEQGITPRDIYRCDLTVTIPHKR